MREEEGAKDEGVAAREAELRRPLQAKKRTEHGAAEGRSGMGGGKASSGMEPPFHAVSWLGEDAEGGGREGVGVGSGDQHPGLGMTPRRGSSPSMLHPRRCYCVSMLQPSTASCAEHMPTSINLNQMLLSVPVLQFNLVELLFVNLFVFVSAQHLFDKRPVRKIRSMQGDESVSAAARARSSVSAAARATASTSEHNERCSRLSAEVPFKTRRSLGSCVHVERLRVRPRRHGFVQIIFSEEAARHSVRQQWQQQIQKLEKGFLQAPSMAAGYFVVVLRLPSPQRRKSTAKDIELRSPCLAVR